VGLMRVKEGWHKPIENNFYHDSHESTAYDDGGVLDDDYKDNIYDDDDEDAYNNEQKVTPGDFLTAARENNIALISSILDLEPQRVHYRDENGWQALHEAVRNGNFDSVQLLVEKGKADVNSRTGQNETGPSVLWWAHNSLSVDHPVVVYLVEKGAHVVSPGAKVPHKETTNKDAIETEPLKAKVGEEDSTITNDTIDELSLPDDNNNDEDMNKDSDFGDDDDDDDNYYDDEGDDDDNYYDDDDDDEFTFIPNDILSAARQNDITTLSRILHYKPQWANHRDENGWEALHEAVRSKSLDAIRLLVEEGGVNVNSRTGKHADGGSPLWWAHEALPANHPVVVYLVKQGAHAIATDSEKPGKEGSIEDTIETEVLANGNTGESMKVEVGIEDDSFNEKSIDEANVVNDNHKFVDDDDDDFLDDDDYNNHVDDNYYDDEGDDDDDDDGDDDDDNNPLLLLFVDNDNNPSS